MHAREEKKVDGYSWMHGMGIRKGVVTRYNIASEIVARNVLPATLQK
jgi:hypothetical protein